MPEVTQSKKTEDELVRQFDSSDAKPKKSLFIIAGVVVILLGLGTGFVIAKGTSPTLSTPKQVNNASQVTKGTALGTNDTGTFKDVAQGKLVAGGIDGEGQYHIERPGGKTQFVYLTSSVVDLSLVEGREVKVWGQTQKAQHAPWLMDVGRVEVEN